MSLVLLGSTSRSGLSVEQVGGNDVYKMYPQLQAILEQEGCKGRSLFAEPQEAGRDIDWYVETGGKVIPLGKLPPEEQDQLISSLDAVFDDLKSCAARLRKDGLTGSNYADIIEKALVCPADMREEVIYSVDGKPVMTCWGFSDGNRSLVDGIKDLVKQVQRNLAAKAAAPQVEKTAPAPEPPAPEPEQPAPEPEKPAPEPEQPAPEPEKPVPAAPVTPIKEEIPAAQPAPAQRQSHTGLYILLALLLLGLLALALWYFLFNKDEAAKGPVFQGTLSANNVLTNMQNQKVDVSIVFDNGTDVGRVLVKENNQTCRGDISAARGSGKDIIFKVNSVPCPNGDHYDAFTLECRNGPRDCDFISDSGARQHLELTQE